MQAVDERRGRCGLRGAGRVRYGDRFVLRGESHFEVKDGRGAGEYSDGLFLRGETGLQDGDEVFAERNGIEVEFAVGVGLCRLCVLRRFGFKQNGHTEDRAVLRVVGDAADGAENGSERG